jgi:hypothetical protein
MSATVELTGPFRLADAVWPYEIVLDGQAEENITNRGNEVSDGGTADFVCHSLLQPPGMIPRCHLTPPIAHRHASDGHGPTLASRLKPSIDAGPGRSTRVIR